MSVLTTWILCVTTGLLWNGVYPDCFTLYSYLYARGSKEELCVDTKQFGALDNKAKSIRISGPDWLAIFLEPNYQGYCKVLRPKLFNLLSNDVNSASSAHFVSASSHLANCGAQPSMSYSESHKQGPGCGDAIYICKSGYSFKDASKTMIIKCKTNGYWESFPDICRRSCGTVPNVPHSTSVISGHTAGGKVTYTCNNGYVFNGDATTATIKCISDSWQTPPNGCNEIICGKSKPSVSNAVPSGSDRNMGSVGTYTCSTGYVYPNGRTTQTITCGTDGSWGTPVYSTCQIVTCDATPPSVKNTTRVIRTAVYNGFTSYTCIKGHEFPDKSTKKNIKCGAQGTWEAAPPPCQAKRCTSNKVIANTKYADTGDLYGSTRIYTCDVGHEFADSSTSVTLTCQSDETWSASTSSCPAKRCPSPPNVQNRNVVIAEGIHYKARVTYQCISGHVASTPSLSEEIAWCTEDKSWNATPSACIRHEYYIGCAALSSLSDQTFQKQSLNALSGDPVDVCRRYCVALHTFQLAGLTKGSDCRCYGGPAPSSVTADETCNTICNTNRGVKCGSSAHITLFYAGQNCSTPPQVERSSADISLSSSSYLYNTAINFTCLDETQFSDGNISKSILCGSSGQWSPSVGNCSSIGKYISTI